VKIPELADGDTQYDGAKYCEYLLCAAESILLPFGYTERRLDEIMKGISEKIDLLWCLPFLRSPPKPTDLITI